MFPLRTPWRKRTGAGAKGKETAMKIGKYIISHFSDYPDGTPSVWIEGENGEGGQFPLAQLEKVIEDYYRENF